MSRGAKGNIKKTKKGVKKDIEEMGNYRWGWRRKCSKKKKKLRREKKTKREKEAKETDGGSGKVQVELEKKEQTREK